MTRRPEAVIEALRAGGGADAGAVLGDAMEIDEVVFAPGAGPPEHVTVVAAEVVEGVIVRRHAQGDVERHRAGPLAARAMRHAGARPAGLAARACALATPGPELETELAGSTPGRRARRLG